MSSMVIVITSLITIGGSTIIKSSAPPHPWLVATRQDTVCFESEYEYDLTRNGIDEQFKVKAIGTEWKKMQFELTIKDKEGEVLFSGRWTSQGYFNAPQTFNPFTPEGGERLIRLRMDGMFDEGSFRIGFPYARTPEGVRQALQRLIRKELGSEATEDRIDRLCDELAEAHWYVYLKGHEDVAVLAWSHIEQRIVNLTGIY